MGRGKLLFSLTRKDFEISFFSKGKGGQHVNAHMNGVRIRHPASGVIATAHDGRDRPRNQALALRRLTEHPTFRAWHKCETARRLMLEREMPDIEKKVDEMMRPENIKVEYVDMPAGA